MKRFLLASPFLAALVVAQQGSGPQPKAGSLVSGPRKSTPSSTANRPNTKIGVSIAQVVDRLIAGGAAKGKGEFETTEEYDSRQKALAAQFTELAFLLPKDSVFDAAPFAYDADHAEMQVHLRAMREFLHNNDDLTEVKALQLASSDIHTGTSFRTGASGRRVRIDTKSEYGIIISPHSPIRFDLYEPYFNNVLPSTVMYRFPINVTLARTVKPFLRAVIVGRLDEGHVYQESDTDPNLGNYSDDLRRDRFYIQFNVEEIQVVDVRTGETLKVIHPNEEGR
jgi:hypothetical protein